MGKTGRGNKERKGKQGYLKGMDKEMENEREREQERERERDRERDRSLERAAGELPESFAQTNHKIQTKAMKQDRNDEVPFYSQCA